MTDYKVCIPRVTPEVHMLAEHTLSVVLGTHSCCCSSESCVGWEGNLSQMFPGLPASPIPPWSSAESRWGSSFSSSKSKLGQPSSSVVIHGVEQHKGPGGTHCQGPCQLPCLQDFLWAPLPLPPWHSTQRLVGPIPGPRIWESSGTGVGLESAWWSLFLPGDCLFGHLLLLSSWRPILRVQGLSCKSRRWFLSF
jgi:hypothetical protein